MLSQNFFKLEASLVESQSLKQKETKRRNRNGCEKKNLKIPEALISAHPPAKML